MSGNGKKSGMGVSDAMLAAARAKRVNHPLLVTGVGPGRYTMLPVEEHKQLNIDERYQRIKIPSEISQLVYVLRSGGVVPDPITVAKRKDGTLWVIDGQQRMWAYFECRIPMPMMIHPVDGFESERTWFLVMQQGVAVNADAMVYSWSGRGAEMIRGAADRPGSPILDRVNFGRGTRGLSFGAAILAKACNALLYHNVPSASGGRISIVLSRLDAAMESSSASLKMSAFFKLMAEIIPTTHRVKILTAVALGRVAGARWYAKVEYPSPAIISKIRRINWDALVPTYAAKYLPSVIHEIERKWPKEIRVIPTEGVTTANRLTA